MPDSRQMRMCYVPPSSMLINIHVFHTIKPSIGPPLICTVLTDRPDEDPYAWDFERLESWRAPGSALRRSKPNVALPPKETLTQADLSVSLLPDWFHPSMSCHHRRSRWL